MICCSLLRSRETGTKLKMTPEEFSRYKHDAVHELMVLNENCDQRFKINSLPRWSYDLNGGTLTFSEDGIPKVTARIEVVGTTSRDLGNWMWGWANRSLPLVVTETTSRVREFGEDNDIQDLATPTLRDDEHLGWEMTAITAKVIGAKGAYRCPSDDGFIYLVYLDIDVAPEGDEAGETNLPIKCGDHNEGFPTFICEHLASTPEQEWFSNPPCDEDPWPDAWCSPCEVLFQEYGEWNDTNSAKRKIKMVCHHCYESLRAKLRAIQ